MEADFPNACYEILQPIMFKSSSHCRGKFFDGQRIVTSWDGTEIRLLWLMAEMLNFTFIVEEPAEARFL
jgi:hypothetical protein